MARLHKALKKMGTTAVYESDLLSELKTQLTNIKTENIDIPYEIINSCHTFENEYNLLPTQLIHRDIQFGNILFENGRLKCFLDFDSSQVNARLFDLAYFGQSILFNNNYRDNKFIIQWINFFSSLLHGYNSENILYENEIKSIHIFCIILQFSFISYYLYSEDKRELVPKRVDLLKWIYANESIFAFSLSFAN
jgi:Ser/Thr protein kinase RdoA (MazF antagonist)